MKTYFNACSKGQKITEGLGVIATPQIISRIEFVC